MDELKEYRMEITKIDEQMAALFEKRMLAASRIAAYKQKHGLSVRDRLTEAKKIDSQKDLISDETLRSYYVQFLQSVMDISSSYQESLLMGTKTKSRNTVVL